MNGEHQSIVYIAMMRKIYSRIGECYLSENAIDSHIDYCGKRMFYRTYEVFENYAYKKHVRVKTSIEFLPDETKLSS